jgi:hypothetical protein
MDLSQVTWRNDECIDCIVAKGFQQQQQQCKEETQTNKQTNKLLSYVH